jgi:hypothetical protein
MATSHRHSSVQQANHYVYKFCVLCYNKSVLNWTCLCHLHLNPIAWHCGSSGIVQYLAKKRYQKSQLHLQRLELHWIHLHYPLFIDANCPTNCPYVRINTPGLMEIVINSDWNHKMQKETLLSFKTLWLPVNFFSNCILSLLLSFRLQL